MPWIIFDDDDRRTPAPYFRLEATTGEVVSPERFHERESLVIFFAHRLNCAPCREALQAFAGLRAKYIRLEAGLLTVFPEPAEELRADPFLAGLPWPVVSDPKSTVRRRYADLVAAELVKAGDSLLFVLDQYGAPYAALVQAEFDSQSIHRDVMAWWRGWNLLAYNARSEGFPNGPSGHRRPG
jgi:peroxiredoxin